MLFALIWPFKISHFEVCLFFGEGGGRKSWNHLFPVMLSIWHFSRRMWLSVYVLHCVTAHCFFIILTLVWFCFGFCICVMIWFLVLLWYDFFCWCSRDSSCRTIKGVSQKRAEVCCHCKCSDEGRNGRLSWVRSCLKAPDTSGWHRQLTGLKICHLELEQGNNVPACFYQ